METALNVLNIGHVIELAVAPVFLLTGIGAILSVLTNRLGRSVDRYRVLNELGAKQQSVHREEMKILTQRVRWIHWAISLCTTSALLISIVIVTLFLGSFAKVNVSLIITMLFIAAMFTLILGLLSFLREIYLATGAMQMERQTKSAGDTQ
jgi:hypothetical protein